MAVFLQKKTSAIWVSLPLHPEVGTALVGSSVSGDGNCIFGCGILALFWSMFCMFLMFNHHIFVMY